MCSTQDPLSLLPPRLIANVLIEAYFNSFGHTHRIFHRPTYEKELRAFWDNPVVWESDPFLSQLFMVLALGCHAYDAQILSEAGYDKAALIEKCLDGAQLSFRQGRFMSKPTMVVVRTLCMMAIAQQMDLFNDSDAVWILVGLIQRLAIATGLHQDPTGVPHFTVIEADVRRRVWSCIVFLNLQSAIECGMPALMHKDDFSTQPPLNLNDEDLINGTIAIPHPDGVLTEASFQIMLAETFDVVTKVVDSANAPLATIDDMIVSECDLKLRKHLRDGERLFLQTDNVRVTQRCQLIQRATFKAHIRHAMLVPHQCYLALPQHLQKLQPTNGSHWGILDSSLALLVLQRNLEDMSDCLWLTDLLKDHFMVAAIQVGVGLRRGDYAELPGIRSTVSPQETAYETLRACLEIWAKRVKRTVDNYKLYIGLTFMIHGLDAMRYGTPMLEAVQRAAEHCIATALS